jgi:hypothetical protein
MARDKRICHLCNCNDREDEIHIFICKAYEHVHHAYTHVFNSEHYRNLKTAYENGDMTDEVVKNFMNYDDSLFMADFTGFLRRHFAIRRTMLS